MDPLKEFILHERLPEDPVEAKQIIRRSANFIIHEEKLLRKSTGNMEMHPFLQCLHPGEADLALRGDSFPPKEVPSVLWSYQTTHKAATGETPFRLAYGANAVIPLEVQMSSLRLENFDEDRNNEGLRLCAMRRDKVEDSTLARIIVQKQPSPGASMLRSKGEASRWETWC